MTCGKETWVLSRGNSRGSACNMCVDVYHMHRPTKLKWQLNVAFCPDTKLLYVSKVTKFAFILVTAPK